MPQSSIFSRLSGLMKVAPVLLNFNFNIADAICGRNSRPRRSWTCRAGAAPSRGWGFGCWRGPCRARRRHRLRQYCCCCYCLHPVEYVLSTASRVPGRDETRHIAKQRRRTHSNRNNRNIEQQQPHTHMLNTLPSTWQMTVLQTLIIRRGYPSVTTHTDHRHSLAHP